jgi:threonine dehydrogenase-like Zn-dependent dehydrogenase
MAVAQQLETVAVVGNGLMGHGITQVFAAGGRDVYMIGRNADRLAEAVGKIRASLAQFVGEALLSKADAEAALARIATSTDLADAGRAELVIEAVTEDIPSSTKSSRSLIAPARLRPCWLLQAASRQACWSTVCATDSGWWQRTFGIRPSSSRW